MSDWDKEIKVSMGDRYLHKTKNTTWRVYAANFYENEVELKSVDDEHIRWVGTTQQLRATFKGPFHD